MEELRLILHTSGRLPLVGKGIGELKDLFESLSGEKIAYFKPVIGAGLFALESGVHVDGLMKEPNLYEPFPPELVGAKRYLAVGLHSGHKSLGLKCKQLGITASESQLRQLLPAVKSLALTLERGLTDPELLELAYSIEILEKREIEQAQQSPQAPLNPHKHTGQSQTRALLFFYDKLDRF
jgi:homocitrate synthase NifV